MSFPQRLGGGHNVHDVAHRGEDALCQLCFVDFTNMSLNDKQKHYDAHFTGPSQSGSSAPKPHHHPRQQIRSKANMSSRQFGKMKAVFAQHDPAKENIFWYPAQSKHPPPNFSPGLIPVLKRALSRCHARGNTQKAVLCYQRAVHVATESWDMGWGCGYRNFLMACAAVMDQPFQPLYWPIIDASPSPGVRNLQTWIEHAWHQGFDADGARQLQHKLVGTKKWIGTAELYVAFTARGIPCQLVDFDVQDKDARALTDWVREYFTPKRDENAQKQSVGEALRGAAPVYCTDRMPLVLQHAGHSRTIIGYELTKSNDVNLLVFDPSIRPRADLRQAALAAVPARDALANTTSHPQSGSNSGSISQPDASPNKHHQLGGAIRKALHPIQHHKAKKRRMTASGSGLHDAIVVEDDDDGRRQESRPHRSAHPAEEGLDPAKVVSLFRLNPRQLGRKDKYQILYFPLTEPLNEAEQRARRVVTSQKAS